MRRCPVELTGKNSVRPSTIPSKIDNKKSCITFPLSAFPFSFSRLRFYFSFSASQLFKKPLRLRARPSGSGSLLPLPSRKLFRRQSFRSWLIAGSPRPRAGRDRHPHDFKFHFRQKIDRVFAAAINLAV